MKKYRYIFPTFLFFFSFMLDSINAQQVSDENAYIINQYFQNINASEGSFLENNKPSSNLDIAQVDYIKLNQVGNNNEINIKSTIGNSQTVNQFGNNNNYEFLNYYNTNISNFNILQQGNSNSLEIYGENSLIRNINIIQNSDFQTLVIRNY